MPRACVAASAGSSRGTGAPRDRGASGSRAHGSAARRPILENPGGLCYSDAEPTMAILTLVLPWLLSCLLVPPLVVIEAHYLFGETLGVLSIIGMLVCVVGVYIVSRSAKT